MPSAANRMSKSTLSSAVVDSANQLGSGLSLTGVLITPLFKCNRIAHCIRLREDKQHSGCRAPLPIPAVVPRA